MTRLRVCCSCKRALDLNENFCRSATGPLGRSKTCKDCRSRQQKRSYARLKAGKRLRPRGTDVRSLADVNFERVQQIKEGEVYELGAPGRLWATHTLKVQALDHALRVEVLRSVGTGSIEFIDEYCAARLEDTGVAMRLARRLTGKALELRLPDGVNEVA